MIEVPLTEDSLRAALGRIQDFVRVHDGDDDVLPPFTVLRESLGITDELMELYSEWAEILLSQEGVAAPMLLGLIVGLIAADYGSQP